MKDKKMFNVAKEISEDDMPQELLMLSEKLDNISNEVKEEVEILDGSLSDGRYVHSMKSVRKLLESSLLLMNSVHNLNVFLESYIKEVCFPKAELVNETPEEPDENILLNEEGV